MCDNLNEKTKNNILWSVCLPACVSARTACKCILDDISILFQSFSFAPPFQHTQVFNQKLNIFTRGMFTRNEISVYKQVGGVKTGINFA